MMRTERSTSLFREANQFIPGGVNSPVRSFSGVGGTPRFIDRAQGAELIDVDGNIYLDLMNSWGPMILGHGNPRVRARLHDQLDRGISYGAPTELEVEIARTVSRLVPGAERVRLTSSGTEACMSAIRLARGFTGRDFIVKAAGCYHGHADAFLVAAGSGVLTLGRPSSAGVTEGASRDTLVVPYNDAAAIRDALANGNVAAVILEPVAGNMGCIPPNTGYLAAVRSACTATNTLLIFDEVMTGFRLAHGGAQERFGVRADLVTFGKVIGGGMPIGAIAGCADIMDRFSPGGPVYQAGTLSGNPLAVTSGLATLQILEEDPGLYNRIDTRAERLASGLRTIALEHGRTVCVNQCGSMLSIHFGLTHVSNLESAKTADAALYARFFHAMLDQGIMLPPSAFESWFISDALSDEHVTAILSAANSSFTLIA